MVFPTLTTYFNTKLILFWKIVSLIIIISERNYDSVLLIFKYARCNNNANIFITDEITHITALNFPFSS